MAEESTFPPDENRQSDNQAQPPPQVIEVRPSGDGRTPLWILAAVTLGFLLPVCSCAILTFGFISSLGVSGMSGMGSASTGVGDAVAIVRVEGIITSSDDDEVTTGGAPSGIVIDDLRSAAADETVKAIVLRVDSPGGTVTGSAQIYEAILALDKPVIVSMSGVAASGGYYVSAPADYIFARPDTTTGSIGVILSFFNAEEFINEVGIESVAITSGPNKNMASAWDDLTEEQRMILQNIVDESHEDFVRVIADGRNMPLDEVRVLADGRIYSGRQAADNGLVDELGNLQDAIDKAADLGGVSGEPRLVEYERLPSLEQLLLGFSSRLTQTEAERALELMDELTLPRIEYRYAGPLR